MTFGIGAFGTGMFGITEMRPLWLVLLPMPADHPPSIAVLLASDGGTLSDIVIMRGPDEVLHTIEDGVDRAETRDYEAPYGVDVTYTVTAVHSVEGPVSATGVVRLVTAGAYLIHPVRALSVCIDVGNWRNDGVNISGESAQSTSRPARQSRFDPPSRTRSVVFRAGPRMAASWTLVLLTPRLVDRDAIEAILTDQSPLLLRVPAGMPVDLPDGWYQAGDIDVGRVTERLDREVRKITMPLVPCERPPEAVGDVWTWQTLEDSFETWADVESTFESWTELQLGGYS